MLGAKLGMRLGAAGGFAVEERIAAFCGAYSSGKAPSGTERDSRGYWKASASGRMTSTCADKPGGNRHDGRSWPLRLFGIETADTKEAALAAAGAGADRRRAGVLRASIACTGSLGRMPRRSHALRY